MIDRVAVARVLSVIPTEASKNLLIEACEHEDFPFDVSAQAGKSLWTVLCALDRAKTFDMFDMRDFNEIAYLAFTGA